MPTFPFTFRSGTNRADEFLGSRRTDFFDGRGGNDLIRLGAGDDFALGGSGADRIFGGRGDDAIDGGSGRDVIAGGSGNDLLNGGSGADFFLFDPSRNGEGRDVIADFRVGSDKIVLNVADVLESTPDLAGAIVAGGGAVAAVFAALDDSDVWGLRANGRGDLVIEHPNGTITLRGIEAAGIDSFADLSGALTVRGLGETLTELGPQTGVPASIAAVVAASGSGFDSNGADFDMLLAAVQAAGLTDALADPDASLTVFAPTDAAFLSLADRLGFEGHGEADAFDFIVEAVTGLGGGDPIPVLTDILRYHVSAGADTLGELQADRSVDTLLENAVLGIRGDRVVDADPDFADARIVASDVQTGNGVIQVVNQVLLPLDL